MSQLSSPDAPWKPLVDPNKGKKRGLMNEALRLERDTARKIRRPAPRVPDSAVTGATLLIGGGS